jgi:hypothetical protein
LNEQMQSAHSAWQTQQEQVHAQELQANDLRHRRDTLVQRLREDYQIDLVQESGVRSQESGVRKRERAQRSRRIAAVA